MTDRPVPPPDALVEADCAWCGNSIFGCTENWHTSDGEEFCLTSGGCFHEPPEELLLAERLLECEHLDDCEIIDGLVYCTECGEPLGDDPE